jgi:hypothetical protein
MMDTRFLRTNLLTLLGYAVLAQLFSLAEQNGGAIIVLMMMMVCVAIHTGVLLLGALILLIGGQKPKAGQWLLAALLVSVIGFGTCWGGAQVAELYSGPAHFQ